MSKPAIHIKNINITFLQPRQPAAMAASLQCALSGAPEIGQPWPEQGGVLAGIMPAQEGHPAYHLIVPTDDAAYAESLASGNAGEDYKNLSAWDGLANTQRLVINGGHPAAEFCANLNINGFADFYLLSRREASLIAATVPHLFKPRWHWTSTQYSADFAFVQDFGDGFQYDGHKNHEGRVRAVRRSIIHSSI